METIFEKYRIEKELGRGGMGVVYLAYDTVLERPVAIKTISSAPDDPILKKRFIREARSAGKLRHNNIVTIHDFGVEEDRLYIVMEYLEGEDLAALISRQEPLDIKEKLEILRQVCVGLDFAHKNGIIHRDVKPANIRILADGSVKIVDFGLALMQSSRHSDLSMSNAIMGTPNYTAPERLAGGDASGQADQFAVGLILYELLTYRRAFTGDTFPIIAYQILHSEPPGLDPAFTGRYPELETIIKRAIKKDPQQRYPSLKEMAAAIESLLSKMRKQGFSRTSAVGTADEAATSGYQVKKKKSTLAALFAMIAFLGLLTLLYFSFFRKGPPEPRLGFLSFDVKPYAAVEAVINLKTDKTVSIDKGAGTTPLRLELEPGEYRIIYSHPGLGEEKRTKIFKIAPGETKYVRDVIDDNFVEEAVKHFSVSPYLIDKK